MRKIYFSFLSVYSMQQHLYVEQNPSYGRLRPRLKIFVGEWFTSSASVFISADEIWEC
jgi:hypothetical protein